MFIFLISLPPRLGTINLNKMSVFILFGIVYSKRCIIAQHACRWLSNSSYYIRHMHTWERWSPPLHICAAAFLDQGTSALLLFSLSLYERIGWLIAIVLLHVPSRHSGSQWIIVDWTSLCARINPRYPDYATKDIGMADNIERKQTKHRKLLRQIIVLICIFLPLL